MTKKTNDLEWTRPVLNSDSQKTNKANPNTTSNGAWTSVAIGVVTKKILQNDAIAEYPFEVDAE